MILETTNPKYFQRPQVSGRIRMIERNPSDIYDGDFVSAGSRNMAKGQEPEANFKDRAPNEAPRTIQSLEPEPRLRPRGSSMWLADESPNHPLWMIKDLVTGHVMARVRGSLPWIVSQMQLAAEQLGGQVNELYYQRVN